MCSLTIQASAYVYHARLKCHGLETGSLELYWINTSKKENLTLHENSWHYVYFVFSVKINPFCFTKKPSFPHRKESHVTSSFVFTFVFRAHLCICGLPILEFSVCRPEVWLTLHLNEHGQIFFISVLKILFLLMYLFVVVWRDVHLCAGDCGGQVFWSWSHLMWVLRTESGSMAE